MLDVITDNLDIWTTAQKQKKAVGRGRAKKDEAYGIKKLRELILELAVRGKLVPQDAGDEPARILLEKIAEDKQRLIEEGIINNKKPFPEIEDVEKPFSLPSCWQWVRVDEIGHNWGQKKPNDDFTYIDVSAIDNLKGKVNKPSVLSEAEAPSRARKIVKLGTVIYSTVRPYLQNICVLDKDFSPEAIASTAFAIVHPYLEMPGSYFTIYFRSPVFINYVESVQTGIAYPAINDKQFFGGIVPIPPLAEQHRIVAKVDELMTLCDQLEQQQADHQTTHQTLVETLLNGLVESAKNQTKSEVNDQQSTADYFNQLIAEHFDTLFTTEQSIDHLKQTILQLAVMGKLVPQDPSDEPASVLLEKIAEEKTRLIKAGKIKKQKALPEIGEDEKPFGLPNEWEWSYLPNIGELARGKSKHRPRNASLLYDGGDIPLVQTGDVARADPEIITYTAKYNESGLEQSRLWSKGTLCITIAANIADTGILNFDACFPDSIVGFNSFEANINVAYFDYFIRTAKNHLEDFAPATAQKNINLAILGNLLIPLPPLNELNRIVSKVNQLLTLCDSLKANLNQAQTTQTHLADALVKQAIN